MASRGCGAFLGREGVRWGWERKERIKQKDVIGDQRKTYIWREPANEYASKK